jgi:ASC-1-like (ASCH) protein
MELFIKGHYFRQIKSGRKTLEARINYSNLRHIRSGDILTFKSGPEQVSRRVVQVRHYNTLQEMVKSEDLSRLLPGVLPDRVLAEYHKFYSDRKVASHNGVLVFELQ